MTETAESTATAEQLARVAALRTRRARTDPPIPTNGPSLPAPTATPFGHGRATGGRILAAGLGAGATLGLVALFGMNDGSAATVVETGPAALTQSVAEPGPSAPQPVPPPIRVVIHRTPTTGSAQSVAVPPPTATAAASTTTSAPITAPAPVDLMATPIVETITVAAPRPPAAAPSAPAAPQATTTSSGS